jgi:hypothetical protein
LIYLSDESKFLNADGENERTNMKYQKDQIKDDSVSIHAAVGCGTPILFFKGNRKSSSFQSNIKAPSNVGAKTRNAAVFGRPIAFEFQ